MLKKNPAAGRDCYVFKTLKKKLCCFLYFPGFDAIRAYLNTLHSAGREFDPCVLKVREKTSRNAIMCVADMISCHRFFPAHFTYSCHVQLQSFHKFQLHNNIGRKPARGKEKLHSGVVSVKVWGVLKRRRVYSKMEQRLATDEPAQEINPYGTTFGQRKATKVARRSQ